MAVVVAAACGAEQAAVEHAPGPAAVRDLVLRTGSEDHSEALAARERLLGLDAALRLEAVIEARGDPDRRGKYSGLMFAAYLVRTGRMGEEAGEGLMRSLADHDDPLVRLDVALALSSIGRGDSKTKALILEGLYDPAEGVREWALTVYDELEMAEPSALRAMMNALRRGDWVDTILAFAALRRLGPEAAPACADVLALLQRRREPYAAMDALAAIGAACTEPGVAAVLVRYLVAQEAEDPELRMKALRALRACGPSCLEGARAQLVRVAEQDPVGEVRALAHELLDSTK